MIKFIKNIFKRNKSIDFDNLTVVGEPPDEVRDEILRRVMSSGSPVMATVNAKGEVTYIEGKYTDDNFDDEKEQK